MKFQVFTLVSILAVSITSSYAAFAPTTESATAQIPGIQSPAVDSSAILVKLRQNIPTIIAKARILAPKAQALAQGGARGFISGIFSAAVDPATRDAGKQLVSTLVDTLNNVVKLSQASPDVKQQAINILRSLAQDKDVQSLLTNAKNIPIVGDILHEKLQDIIQAKEAL